MSDQAKYVPTLPPEAVEAAARAWVGSMMDDPAKKTAQEDVRATCQKIIQAFLDVAGWRSSVEDL